MPRLSPIAVCTAAVSLVLAGCGGGDAKPELLFGFNDDAIRAGLITPEKDADLTARAGANVHRVTVDWRWVEPQRDRYDWAIYDDIYRAMMARGVKPLLVLIFAPEWSWKGDHDCTQFGQDCRFPPNPRNDSEWREMAALLARRYPQAAGIEIWNEPNLASFWGPAPDPRRYADLLRQAHGAVKEANPSMRVIGGSMNNVQTAAGGDVPMGEFTRALYSHGAKGAMDALSLHPYPLSPNDFSFMLENLEEVRSARDKAGDEETPLWVTEIGLSTTGALEQGGALSEDQQARGLVALLELLDGMDDVEAVVIHTLLDRQGAPTDVEAGYGVARPDLQLKPAFCALAKARGEDSTC